ncbi:MAG: metallophosphoesterase [Granulosicoccus sp.]
MNIGNRAITAFVRVLLVTLTLAGSNASAALLDIDFDDDAAGFTYNDDVFRGTSTPYYSRGEYITSSQCDRGGCLKVSFGGRDNEDIYGMSGGWTTSFNLTQTTDITLNLRYRIRQLRDYEPNEYTEALVSIDGNLIGLNGKDYIKRIRGNGNGGANIDTGWRTATLNLGTVAAGSHTLTVGGRNNKKTAGREYSSVWIDDISLQGDSAGNEGDIRFGVIGDFGTDTDRQRDVSLEMDSWNLDFIITLGDNRYGNKSMDRVIGQYYCRYMTDVNGGAYCPRGESQINAFFPSPGNHDYNDGGGINEYLDYFTLPGANVLTTGTSGTELYYDFIQGPVHFFAVDSHGSIGTQQKNWLRQGLQASTSAWQIVFFHHPPYSSSSYHGSNVAMQWPFADWGADVIMAGHDHVYERINRDGVVYIVNGLGGRTFYDFRPPLNGSRLRYNNDNGAQRITASSSEIKLEFITRTGTIIDSIRLNK